MHRAAIFFAIFSFFICLSEFSDIHFVKQLVQEKKMCSNVKFEASLEAADLLDTGNLLEREYWVHPLRMNCEEEKR